MKSTSRCTTPKLPQVPRFIWMAPGAMALPDPAGVAVHLARRHWRASGQTGLKGGAQGVTSPTISSQRHNSGRIAGSMPMASRMSASKQPRGGHRPRRRRRHPSSVARRAQVTAG